MMHKGVPGVYILKNPPPQGGKYQLIPFVGKYMKKKKIKMGEDVKTEGKVKRKLKLKWEYMKKRVKIKAIKVRNGVNLAVF
jgi:predicted secreted protein